MTTPHDAEEAMRPALGAKYEADTAVKTYAGDDVREYAHLLSAALRDTEGALYKALELLGVQR